MLDESIFDHRMSLPSLGLALYKVTKRRAGGPRDDDPEAGDVTRSGDVFDLRSPHGDVIATDHDLCHLRAMQTKYNAVALLG